jgi:phosphatidylglycerophosphate synthase
MYLFPSWRKKKYAFLKGSSDWWTGLVLDLFAIPATIVLYKLSRYVKRITPNGISLVSFIVFYLGVALLFARPNDNAYFTLCFFLSSVLDCMDGKLARLRGEGSQFGAIVDQFFDMLKHSLGLMLVGLALSVKLDSPYLLIIMLPHALWLGVGHMNAITRDVLGYPEEEVICENHKTKWQLFCAKRGLNSNVYNQAVIIYVVILLVGINLRDPTVFLLVGIYIRSILSICKKRRRAAAVVATSCGAGKICKALR